MNLRPPGFPSEEGRKPVFENFTKTAAGGELLLRRYRLRCDPQVFAELAPFYEIWRAKLQGEQLPRWSDFAFEEFVGWHRYVILSDISAEDSDPKFRIFGSGVAEVMGRDMTGKRVSDTAEDAMADGVIDHFADIRDRRLVGFLSGKLGKRDRAFLEFKVIELPLENEEGEVTQILHCFAPLPRVG